MSEHDALREMIERFGPFSTLNLLLAEVERLRGELAAAPATAADPPDAGRAAGDDPAQLTLMLADEAA